MINPKTKKQEIDQENTVNCEYLTFLMDNEEYGLDILSVQEIRGWSSVRVIPNTPSYIKGVINLRGSIVPIIDMRERFGLHSVEYDQTTVVIVLSTKVNADESSTLIGIVVDAVSEVYHLNHEQIKKTPNFGSKIHTDFILGMATFNEKMIILVDINKLANPEELYEVEQQLKNVDI